MFELYRDNHFISRKPTQAEVAEDMQPGPDHSALFEIIDRTDTPEGILVSRVAVLRSTSGWLTYDLTHLPEPLPNDHHVQTAMDAAALFSAEAEQHEPSAEWCWLNNCHLSECKYYPNCEPNCGHT